MFHVHLFTSFHVDDIALGLVSHMVDLCYDLVGGSFIIMASSYSPWMAFMITWISHALMDDTVIFYFTFGERLIHVFYMDCGMMHYLLQSLLMLWLYHLFHGWQLLHSGRLLHWHSMLFIVV